MMNNEQTTRSTLPTLLLYTIHAYPAAWQIIAQQPAIKIEASALMTEENKKSLSRRNRRVEIESEIRSSSGRDRIPFLAGCKIGFRRRTKSDLLLDLLVPPG